jgi:hypothetical protein
VFDLFLAGVQLLGQILMEVEVEHQTGVGKNVHTPKRSIYRKGYLDRSWQIRFSEWLICISAIVVN